MDAEFEKRAVKAVDYEPRKILENLPGLRLEGVFVDMTDKAYVLREAALKESARDVMEMVEPKAPKWKADAVFIAAVLGALVSIPNDGVVIGFIPAEIARAIYILALGCGIYRLCVSFKARPRKPLPETQRECEQMLIDRIRGASDLIK